MKLTIITVLVTILLGSVLTGCTPATQGSVPGVGPFNTQIFSDEFNGSSINTAVWSYETTATGWQHSYNNELQDYVDNGTSGANAFIAADASDSSTGLVLRATRKNPSAPGNNAIHDFNAARIITKGNFSFTYGRVEARMKLPTGNGIWPAFWLLGTGGVWPNDGEIDIMEMIGGSTGAGKGGGDGVAFSTCHWGTLANHPSYGDSTNISVGDYHIYSMTWTSNSITVAIDGTNFYTFDITGSDKACFHRPFYLLLNLAVGGNWPGYPDSATPFPADFVIDYVRVYQ